MRKWEDGAAEEEEKEEEEAADWVRLGWAPVVVDDEDLVFVIEVVACWGFGAFDLNCEADSTRAETTAEEEEEEEEEEEVERGRVATRGILAD